MTTPSPTSVNRGRHRILALGLGFALAATLVGIGQPATAEQAAGIPGPMRARAAQLDAGGLHTCAVLGNGTARCWGDNANGQLGYGNINNIGDDEAPDTAGPVNLGPGRTATAITGGNAHSCAILDNGSVRCWGDGADGRIGSGNTDTIGDDETPDTIAPVNLGPGRTATAITAGTTHTCAVLDNGTVRCWGSNTNGELGYGNTTPIGDTETPDTAGPVNLGPGRTAVAVTAGDAHTCAILDNGSVRCWGINGFGQLGYGTITTIGDTETPNTIAPVNLGPGRTATAITAGTFHTCAILDNGTVRCWGYNASGQLGYGHTDTIGDTETPNTIAPVNLGPGRTATAIAAGTFHTCATLDNGTVRCWGANGSGQLGYGNTSDIGDNETPDTVVPVNLGPGRTASAITTGIAHSCAALDDGTVRCWGINPEGELGYGNTSDIGDNETPDTAGPVRLGGLLTKPPTLAPAPVGPHGKPHCRTRTRHHRLATRCMIAYTSPVPTGRATLVKKGHRVAKGTLRNGRVVVKAAHRIRHGRYVLKVKLTDPGGHMTTHRNRVMVR